MKVKTVDQGRSSPSAEVRAFCELVSENTNKSITLLNAIDQTIGWLILLQDRAKADSAFASKTVEVIGKCERIRPFDSDGTLCSTLEEAERSLERLHQILISKRQFGINAEELQGEDKDTIVSAYTDAIANIADLHNCMVDLRWKIGEHDAEIESRSASASISSQQELEEFLKTL